MSSYAFERIHDGKLLLDLEHLDCRFERIVVGTEREPIDDMSKIVVIAGPQVGYLMSQKRRREGEGQGKRERSGRKIEGNRKEGKLMLKSSI